MKTICEHHSCTGCGLCASLCPISCITMKPGKIGHLFPNIDNKKCINCGLCLKRCPILNPIDLSSSQHAYAVWSKDESDYRSSTSGGASSVFSQYIILKGGVVYGCAVLQDAIIKHIRIDKIEDLYKIKGSKYVQSSIVEVLPQIKKDVKEEKPVLFLGTPCQIAAVKMLFKETPENLYLVDLVCHGTPSIRFLHNYLKRYIPIGKIDNIKFRSEKEYVINVFSGNTLFYSSKKTYNYQHKDYYIDAFMNGFSLRDSCHQCIYATSKRVSDITIGDFWGLGRELSCEEIPEHKYGISLVLTNTKKGQSLFQTISNKLNVFERPITEAVNGNERLRYPKEKTKMTATYQFCQPFMGDKGAYVFVMKLAKLYSQLRKLLK